MLAAERLEIVEKERKLPDNLSHSTPAHHLCSTKKLQNIKSTRFSRSCAFLLLYFVVCAFCEIFVFNSCISALFSKNGI